VARPAARAARFLHDSARKLSTGATRADGIAVAPRRRDGMPGHIERAAP
jgi:hypothetical protein